jgi:predicted O-linked N-acetylglucosamine transferase (SPINDLY family)
MPETAFLAALHQLTAGTLDLGGVIAAAEQLNRAGQPSLAQQIYTIWIRFNPDHPQVYVAHFNASVLFSATGDLAAAGAHLKSAIEINPEFLPAYINLGGVLEKGGAAQEALVTWHTVTGKLAAVTGPSIGWKLATLKQMGRVLGDHQQLDAAETALRECVQLQPTQREVMEQYTALRLGQCKWPVVAAIEGVERQALMGAIHPLSMAAYTDDALLQLGCAANYVRQITADALDASPADRRDAAMDTKGRRIRVGYISSDLREHAIGYLMSELWELHDREKVEVFAYYCGRPSSDPLNARAKASIEHWREIRDLTDDQAAAMIAADEIDILVDVNGHTRDARTGVFARRPAPIQVNWLGYPGTMGSAFHHYIVADDWTVPAGSEIYYSEKVVRLPCYQPNDRQRAVGERPTRASAGLPDDAFVFCCFNGSQKITRFTFQRWIEILKRVPGSVLWLLEATADTTVRLREAAQAAGLDPARLVFAPKMANPNHLARYPLADLFLDTAPYGAHTTCSDALWMGVPVLTLSGRSFASRVCGSLVRAAGLAELVVEDPQAFIDTAVALAGDAQAIEHLKVRLEAGRATCDLFNMEKLTTRLEDLYRGMCADYQAGQLPQPELTNNEAYYAIGVSHDHEAIDFLAMDDYAGFYRTELARRHRMRPLPADSRLWTQAEIDALERPNAAEPARVRRKKAANA